MDSQYYRVHEEYEVDVKVSIEWSLPLTHDMLNYGLSEVDQLANFYAIIGLIEGYWWPYYIGKVYRQTVSSRHKNSDHVERLEALKLRYPEVTWHLTLGTPQFINARKSATLVDSIEGLLIYACWHDETMNKNKVNHFNAAKHINIENTGFYAPFPRNIGYGVFVSDG